MSNPFSFKTKEYWDSWFSKLFSFFVSFKFIVLVIYGTLSTILLTKGLITGDNWVDVSNKLLAVVMIREAVKLKGVVSWVKDTIEDIKDKKDDGDE